MFLGRSSIDNRRSGRLHQRIAAGAPIPRSEEAEEIGLQRSIEPENHRIQPEAAAAEPEIEPEDAAIEQPVQAVDAAAAAPPLAGVAPQPDRSFAVQLLGVVLHQRRRERARRHLQVSPS